MSNIDEVLHAHILDCIVCDGMEKPPGVIALVTGDGNDNNGRAVVYPPYALNWHSAQESTSYPEVTIHSCKLTPVKQFHST